MSTRTLFKIEINDLFPEGFYIDKHIDKNGEIIKIFYVSPDTGMKVLQISLHMKQSFLIDALNENTVLYFECTTLDNSAIRYAHGVYGNIKCQNVIIHRYERYE